MRKLGTMVERGMTLIELMVVMAIVAILMAIGAASLAAIRGADVDATGSILSGTMTYLSSRAVHDNKTYRLVIDMDQRKFWSETTNDEDPCSRFIPEDADQGLNPEAEAAAPAKKDDDDEQVAADPAFVQKKDALLQRAFEPDTNVTAILTSHQTEAQSGGRAAIYFYPNGQTERALLWIGAKSTDAPTGWAPEITIELHSLGTLTFHSSPVDERDFDLARPEEIQ